MGDDDGGAMQKPAARVEDDKDGIAVVDDTNGTTAESDADDDD